MEFTPITKVYSKCNQCGKILANSRTAAHNCNKYLKTLQVNTLKKEISKKKTRRKSYDNANKFKEIDK